jgi:hypothetical protein
MRKEELWDLFSPAMGLDRVLVNPLIVLTACLQERPDVQQATHRTY